MRSTAYLAYAPNGTPIQGTDDICPGVARVSCFTIEDGKMEPTYDGGSQFHYDGQVTKQIAGALLYLDEDGNSWLEHHLILVDEDEEGVPEPYSDAILDLIEREMALGKLVDALQVAYRAASDVRYGGMAYDFAQKMPAARRDYDTAKASTLAAMKAERP